MGLRIESRTIRLYEFELQLIEKLRSATGQTEEELLLGYIRAGLAKERHENVTYDKLKQEAALALLEAEAKKAYNNSAEPEKKARSRKAKPENNTPEPPSQSDQDASESSSEPTLEDQFLELAEQFALPELSIEQIQPSESYLMRGKKQIRVITIQQIKDEDTAQFRLYDAPDQKLHNGLLKNLINSLRGPIPSHLVAQINSTIAVSE